MSAIVKVPKSKKSSLSNPQKVFMRLRKQIERLQKELQFKQKEADRCLQFYYEQMAPQELALSNVLKEVVKCLYPYYNSHHFSKKEKNEIKEIILNKISQMTFLGCRNDVEIQSIFEKLAGVGYDSIMSNEINDLKQVMERMCESMGVELDFSDVNPMADDREIMEKISEALGNVRHKIKEEKITRQKSKKELDQEMKTEKLHALQKQGLSTIYKQLAKAFHPDLEMNSEQKIEKEKLMKKLTSAYKEKDLHTLLSLEMNWMNQSGKQASAPTEDQLKVYNAVFREQIKGLQEQIQCVLLPLQYFPLQRYLPGIADIFALQAIHREIKDDQKYFQDILVKLQTKEAEKTIKNILAILI
ncbi:MAG: hypothetical protein HY860_02190 [Chlamydiales bacterium]|nr:hypothetical protein [Chlamydiales bacterium]